jgi:hypothetical protein
MLSGNGEIFKHLAKQFGIGAEVIVGSMIRVGDPSQE